MAKRSNISSRARQSGAGASTAMRVRGRPGTRRSRSYAPGHGQVSGFLRSLVQPATLFGMALFALLVVGAVKLWQDGWFDRLIGPKGAPPMESGPIRFPPHERPPAKPYIGPPN